MLTFIRYIEVYFYVCVCGLPLLLNEDFNGGSVPYMHFIVVLAGLKKIVRYIEDFVI